MSSNTHTPYSHLVEYNFLKMYKYMVIIGNKHSKENYVNCFFFIILPAALSFCERIRQIK